MSEARAYAARNRQGSDWFGTAPSAAPVPSPAKAAPPSSPPAAQNGAETPSGRSQMIKPACNSNQWYKYDEKSPASDGTPKKETGKTKSTRQESGDWYSHGTPKTADKNDSKPRVVTSEGESYCRRDKAGSSANWFSHEHAGEATPQGNIGPRVTSKEGSGNASRMRGESENWFSHSGSANGASGPTHVSKGRGVQPKSSEMHHIFHMNAEAK